MQITVNVHEECSFFIPPPLCVCASYTSQGSAAADFRAGGSFNSCFFCKPFLNLSVKITEAELAYVGRSYHEDKSGQLFFQAEERVHLC